jgi:hypothetical protein
MMFDLLPVLVLSAALAAPVPSAAMPLKLEVSTSGGTSVIRIVGESPVACSATYKLQVSDNGGGNQSTTAGNATLAPGVRQTLATVALGADSARTTVARLDVQPCGGAAYQQAWPPAQ